MTAAPAAVAAEAATRVTTVRAFVGRHRRRSWLDWYFAGFVGVIGAIYLATGLATPLGRLNGAAGHAATQAAAAQAVAGAGLVIGVGAGLLLLAQTLGPLALSPADSSWLLLTPLGRRPLLRRPVTAAAAITAVAGALLGVLALAMAGPYLRPAGGSPPGSWLVLSGLAGVGCALAALAAEALAQPSRYGRAAGRACCATVATLAVATGVAGERVTAVTRVVTAGFASLTTVDLEVAAVAAVALAAACWLLLWRSLARFPVSVLRADSARAGRVLLAAEYLNFSLLARIAEDSHWRGRLLPSRPWPRLPPALAVAWADWRRLSRTPWTLVIGAVSAMLPALAGAAITGRDRAGVIAAALLLGALAAAGPGTAAAKRDATDPALRRLLGTGGGRVLAARAALPSLLAAGWLALALTMLCALAVLPGWQWPLLALAGPGLAAAALRQARSAPVSPDQQVSDTPLGTTQPWMISRVLTLIVALAGGYPLLAAVVKGHVSASAVGGQVVVSAIVLGGYLLFASQNM